MFYPTESGDGSKIFGKFVVPNAKLTKETVTDTENKCLLTNNL